MINPRWNFSQKKSYNNFHSRFIYKASEWERLIPLKNSILGMISIFIVAFCWFLMENFVWWGASNGQIIYGVHLLRGLSLLGLLLWCESWFWVFLKAGLLPKFLLHKKIQTNQSVIPACLHLKDPNKKIPTKKFIINSKTQ